MVFNANAFRNMPAVLLFLSLLAALASAADPATAASASANGSAYLFGNWSASNVSVTLVCTPGTSDCNSTLYCIGTSNTCDPTTGGTLYNGTINISADGISYLRYASANSTGGWGDTNFSAIAIDTTAPSISISDDASSSWTASDTVAVSVSDGGSGIANTSFVLKANSTCELSIDADFISGSNGTSVLANNETAFLGKYVCFRVMDNTGRRSYLSSSAINRLDTSSPSVNAGAALQANSQFMQNGSANDSASGIASYSWSKVSGPGSITFGSQNQQNTAIKASQDGAYVIRLSVTDGAGNSASDDFGLEWITAAPEISITAPNSTPMQSKTITASAPGGTLSMATAPGLACDASLAFAPYAPINFSSESDNGKRVCYKVTDALGNVAYKISAPIAGIDTTKPALALKGNPIISIEVFSAYLDEGAVANDSRDGNLTPKIAVSNPVNVSEVGVYTVAYEVKDAAGNRATITRTVKVVDTTAPIITILGNSTSTVELNSNYTDFGATATDNYDGDVTSKIIVSNPVNIKAAGSYNVTYDVEDAAGNKAERAIRTVNVVDSYGWLILTGIGATIIAVAGVAFYLLFMRKKRTGL